MSQHRGASSLPTIWRVPDSLWAVVQTVLDAEDPPKRTGRRRIDPRAALDAIIFRLRTGCQWNRLPREFPDDSSVHRTFQRWVRTGVLERVWAALVLQCADVGGVDWAWQAATRRSGKRGWGGSRGSESDGPRQGRREAQPPGRGRRRAARRGRGCGERA